MRRLVHALGRVAATAWWLALAVGLSGVPAFGPGQARAQGAGVEGGARELMPGVETALRAYADAERALRAWSLPENPERVSDGFAGVSIQIRLDGEVVGRGRAITEHGEDALTPALRSAMREARERLRIPGDALEGERLREAAARMLLAVEVAGELIPITPASFSELDETLSPALVGVAARRGEETAAWFPLEMLAFGSTAGEAMRACVSKVTGDPALVLHPVHGTAARISRDHGVRFAKFRTVQVVQTGVGAKPLVMHRGARVFPRARLTMSELSAWETGLFGHVAARLESREVAFADRALGVMALCESARDDRRARAAVEGLAREAEKMMAPDAGEAAMFLVAAAHAKECLGDTSLGVSSFGEACRKVLAGARGSDGQWVAEVPQRLRGLIVYAWIADSAGEDGRRAAEPMLRAVHREAGAGGVIGHMPWVGWAEVRLAGGGEVRAAAALRDARDRLMEAQWTEDRGGEDDADMSGGFVFAGARLPSWDTSRPLAWLADMACDVRITDDKERLERIGEVMRALRFLRQLSVDESSAWLYGDPGALWGVRAAAWEKSQPLPASAMTLLSVARMRKGLEKTR